MNNNVLRTETVRGPSTESIFARQFDNVPKPAVGATLGFNFGRIKASSSSEVDAHIKRNADFVRGNEQAAAAAMKRAKARALNAELGFWHRMK